MMNNLYKSGYQSRFSAVRLLNYDHVSQLFVFDRKTKTLLSFPESKPITPFFSGNTLTTPSHTAVPGAVRLLPGTLYQTVSPVANATALDSAYTAGSAGDALFARFFAHDDLTVTKVYFDVASYGGTAANVNDISVEIRSGTSSAPTMTGGGLLSSEVVNPSSVVGWSGATGLSAACTKGNFYWVVVADPDGNGTDFARVSYSSGASGIPSLSGTNAPWVSYVSTNGGSSVTPNAYSSFVLIFSNGETLGASYNGSTTANNANQKGIVCPNGLPFIVRLRGLILQSVTASTITGGNMWLGSGAGPNGTGDMNTTTTVKQWNTTTTLNGVVFDTVTPIPVSTTFRAVFTFSGAGVSVTKRTITPNITALKAALPGRGYFGYAEANGTTNWDNDDLFAVANVSMLIEEIAPIVSYLPERTYPVVPAGRTYPTYGL